jgi:4-amino-4-deoxy-L-arabinose transferase-like glycosyltransferase
MFIPRMWFDEVERIGKQRCTPAGYALQGLGELVGFVGLLLLLGVPVYMAYRGVVGTFNWSLLWLLTVPFVVGIVGSVIVAFSWSLAYRKKFQYDYERRESSWIEAGQMRTYTFRDWNAMKARRDG